MEKVMIAALKVDFTDSDDTIVMTGIRHADIWEDIHIRFPFPQRNFVVTEGFLTNTNHFVNRIEAKRIAVAAQQLIVPEAETFAELYSEDIY